MLLRLKLLVLLLWPSFDFSLNAGVKSDSRNAAAATTTTATRWWWHHDEGKVAEDPKAQQNINLCQIMWFVQTKLLIAFSSLLLYFFLLWFYRVKKISHNFAITSAATITEVVPSNFQSWELRLKLHDSFQFQSYFWRTEHSFRWVESLLLAGSLNVSMQVTPRSLSVLVF